MTTDKQLLSASMARFVSCRVLCVVSFVYRVPRVAVSRMSCVARCVQKWNDVFIMLMASLGAAALVRYGLPFEREREGGERGR